MEFERKKRGWISAIIFILIALVGVVLRSYLARSIHELPVFVDQALLIDGVNLSLSFANMEDLYTSLFSLFFSLVGNKAGLAIYLQIILQVISIMMLFYTIKVLARRSTAWISYVIFIFTPIAFLIALDQFFFMISSFILYVIAFYIHVIQRKDRSITLKWLFSFLIAAFLVQIALFEAIFVVFILFGFIVAIIYVDAKEKLLKSRIICAGFYLLGIIFSIGTHVLMNYFLANRNIREQLLEIKGIFFTLNADPLKQLQTYMQQIQISSTLIYAIFAIVLCTIIFGFLKKNRKCSISCMLLFFIVLSYQVFFVNQINPYLVLFILLTISFVCGIQAIWSILYEIRQSGLEVAITKEEPEVVADEVNTMEEDVMDENANKVMEEELKKVQFIENPLPLPKKHVAKTLGYRFEPKAEDMHYDI